MQNTNIDNLDVYKVKKRVRQLMTEHKVGQKVLSTEIGMTQPNLSRALSMNDSQCFTLEQTYKLAQRFGVSVDFLLGIEKPSEIKTEKEICKLFTELIEKRKLVTFDYTREEKIIYPYDSVNNYNVIKSEEKDITYNAFLFPNCLDLGPLDRYEEDELEDMNTEIMYEGNDDPSNLRINAFFTKYLQIYNMYVHNQLTDELFHEITDKFMLDLK